MVTVKAGDHRPAAVSGNLLSAPPGSLSPGLQSWLFPSIKTAEIRVRIKTPRPFSLASILYSLTVTSRYSFLSKLLNQKSPFRFLSYCRRVWCSTPKGPSPRNPSLFSLPLVGLEIVEDGRETQGDFCYGQ